MSVAWSAWAPAGCGADGAGTIGLPPQVICGRRSAGTRITTTFAVQTVLAS
jgi:hypothetical protein